MQNITAKKLLLGITGGIAAYKDCELVRLCKKSQIEVKVIMTRAAQKFVTPLTLATLTGNKVYTEMFEQNLVPDIEHIELARWADMILIAPATANIIAKLAHGIANDLLSTVCLATDAPVLIAPAMNQHMWHHARTQQNIKILQQQGYNFVGPATGYQACGETGPGRMSEPEAIFANIENLFANKNLLRGRKFLITAGPTHEPLDGVRYFSNYSSGKMGYAIAHAAATTGADVTLISGPTHLTCSDKIKKINVTTAQEMFEAVMEQVQQQNVHDVFIAAAAVADYRPAQTYAQKQKRQNAPLTLQLEPTPDILAHVKSLANPPFTVGFAAETENLAENAVQKLHNKKVDMLVANKVGYDHATKQMHGFENDDNELFIFYKNGSNLAIDDIKPIHLSNTTKTILAHQLIKLIAQQLQKN